MKDCQQWAYSPQTSLSTHPVSPMIFAHHALAVAAISEQGLGDIRTHPSVAMPSGLMIWPEAGQAAGVALVMVSI